MKLFAKCIAVLVGIALTGLVLAQTTPFVSVVPARLMDTRPGNSTVDGQFAGGGPLASLSKTDLTILGRDGIPSLNVGAVVLNVTITGATAAGYLTAWPTGLAQPATSNLNFVAGQSISNQVIVKVRNGQVSLYLYAGAGSANVVADVAGYFPSASAFTALTPARLLDTRVGNTTIDGQFAGGGAVVAGGRLDLLVSGRGGVPSSGVSAVVVNVTATNPTAPSFITVWPNGNTLPNASNLNVVAGQTIPNLVMVGVGTGGKISLYNNAGSTDLIADVVGYFPSTAPAFDSLVPSRLLDTRAGGATVDGLFSGTGALSSSGPPLNLTVLGRGNVPATGVGAVALNITAVTPTGTGFITAWGTNTTGSSNPTPLAMQLNFTAGSIIPSLVIAQVGANGQVSLANSAGSTDVVADVVGWFPAGYGFFDQGFFNGPVATDYYDPSLGTASSPLQTTPCIFSVVSNNTAARCGLTHSFSFAQSNYWNQNWPGSCPTSGLDASGKPCTNNWVAMFNNDTNYSNIESNGGGAELAGNIGSNITGNSGPPDASFPYAQPAQGLFGFSTYNYGTPNNDFWRANLRLDLGYLPNTAFGNRSGPWLGFGAIDRGNGLGNGHPIGALNPSSGVPSTLHFGAHLWDVVLAPQPGWGTGVIPSGYTLYNVEVYILAKWGTVPKWIGVLLYHNFGGDTSLTPAAGFIPTTAWNWPFPQSGMYPGAALSQIVAEAIPTACSDNTILTTTSTSPTEVLSLNSYPYHEVNYTINVQKLFACANSPPYNSFSGFIPYGGGSNVFNEPLPSTANIPIFGVIWSVEAAGMGGGHIFLDVHQMSMSTQ